MILYGPDGKPVTSLWEAIRSVTVDTSRLLPVIEALSRKNNLLQDATWVRPAIFYDQFGRVVSP